MPVNRNTLHEPFKRWGKGEWGGREWETVCVCVCVEGGVSVVRQSFILSPQLNPHQAADSGSLRSGGELATRMKKLTLFAHILSEILLYEPCMYREIAAQRGVHSPSTFLFQIGLIWCWVVGYRQNNTVMAGREEGEGRISPSNRQIMSRPCGWARSLLF